MVPGDEAECNDGHCPVAAVRLWYWQSLGSGSGHRGSLSEHAGVLCKMERQDCPEPRGLVRML